MRDAFELGSAEKGSRDGDGDGDGVGFTEFSLDELRAATEGFSPDHIVSEHGQKAPNVVYLGRFFPADRDVAIKRFNKFAWPDARQFLVRLTSSPFRFAS